MAIGAEKPKTITDQKTMNILRQQQSNLMKACTLSDMPSEAKRLSALNITVLNKYNQLNELMDDLQLKENAGKEASK